MSEQTKQTRTLKDIELEVLAEGREWMRQRLKEKLEQESERDGRIFPPQPTKSPASAHSMDANIDRSGRD